MRKDSPRPIRRLLVANRGEIAIRVLRACRELGIESVAVYSDADAEALHVEAADVALRIGPAAAAASYLDAAAILAAARRSGADAIHPGYGFLSENAGFAQAVADAGLTFVGPPPATIAALGDKLAARRSAAAVGVATVPGLQVALDADADGRPDPGLISEVGLPLLVKAAAGGGGRGMRLVERAEDLPAAVSAGRREALAAFGDGTLYLERRLAPARHIEVQLLGDRHGQLAVLGARDCSIQRRHQKLVEEAPAPGIGAQLRTILHDAARRMAGTVDFHSAATVEFLVDGSGAAYFLEMNTRLQVEHGVSELVCGQDIVAWQIRIAGGERLSPEALAAEARGHAIEVRLYAEDPFAGFAPSAGTVTTWRLPDGPGIRVDAGVRAGSRLPPDYDPLLAKLMVHAPDRAAALARLRRALIETLIGGVQTNLAFFHWLVDEPRFASGEVAIDLVEERWQPGPATVVERQQAASAAAAARAAEAPARPPTPMAQPTSAWLAAGRRAGVRRGPGR